MKIDKLEKWADLLLDTGKRNNLVNFKDTKLGTVEIVFPSFDSLSQKIISNTTLEVFDPKIEVFDKDDSLDAGKDKLTKDEYIATFSSKIKRNQILVYNALNKPIEALKNIRKKASSAIEETGVNIAYIGMGFIHWIESEYSSIEMKAPLLLAPVSIENQSACDPFFIKILEDDIIVNPTFAYKLFNEYGIKLPEYDEDKDIHSYFDEVSALLSKLNWEVTNECKIGIFSFQKINMYEDLKANTEKISKNPSIRALLGESISMSDCDIDEKEKPDLLELVGVVDADSSQAEAIEMAKRGRSFVLQGPPGTGKSQTITNIIAECLYDGKKVLFVSEKLAALNVVYEKLKKAGLEDFCLELHSHKANKKQVTDELCRTLKLPKSGISDEAEKELRNKRELQKQLDFYAVELHKIRPNINKSLYKLYEEISSCRNIQSFEYSFKNIKNKGESYFEDAQNLLARYVLYTDSIGYDYHKNVWFGYTNTDSSYHTVIQLKNDLITISEFARQLSKLDFFIKSRYSISANSIKDARSLMDLLYLIGKSEFITPSLFDITHLDKVIASVKELKKLQVKITSLRSSLDLMYDEDFYKLDGKLLHKQLAKQYSGLFSRLFSKEYKKIITDIRLSKKDGKKVKYDEAFLCTSKLSDYQDLIDSFAKKESDIKHVLGTAYLGLSTDFEQLLFELKKLNSIMLDYDETTKLSLIEQDFYNSEKSTFLKFSNEYKNLFEENKIVFDGLCLCYDRNEYDLLAKPLLELAEKLEKCSTSIDSVDNWCNFVKLLKLLHERELRDYIDFTITNSILKNEIVLNFKKIFYSQWVDCILHESPILLELSRIPHDEIVEKFKQKDTLNFEINKARIKSKLSAQRPQLDMVAQGSAISVLLREGEKKRKKKGIRVLLSEIGELVQTLKPCFLMSPLSVSTFLSSDIKFDVVIFDEASQIFPQDAIGAIYRGKQLIVVGDSKQMPPSNFFNSSNDNDIDEDDEDDINDFESILDLCSTSFPQKRLKWHYRSRYEQLISFSNKNFYDNDLITFPSSKSDTKGIGVDYYYVDGIFDRKSKTNRVEAEKIVDLVFENLEKYPERSLGVVAFSISQQNLIEKLIFNRRKLNPSFEPFFTSDKNEPFFVKNLETVQGDERDTIIFSVAYAKDCDGRLLLNFGPINREGGERRLNVAVTRAKHNIQLVTSLHYTDIDLSRTKSVGARLLCEYLDYAENGIAVLSKNLKVTVGNVFENCDSEFELEICDFLANEGYSFDTQVGCSSFKIDIAIKRPDSSDYVLAIECDGASYHSSKTARDRDRLRQEILERMGWMFYRIWSTDWFRNKKIEKERLLNAVENALAFTPTSEQMDKNNSDEETFFEIIEDEKFNFPEYEQMPYVKIIAFGQWNILETTKKIVELESPISEEWLLRRIVHLFGLREKVTNVVKREFEDYMYNCSKHGIIRRNGFLYSEKKEIPMLRVPKYGDEPRDIEYIELQELANGLMELIKQNVSVEKKGLFKLLANYLGFSRTGDAMIYRFEMALSLLKDSIEINGPLISIK